MFLEKVVIGNSIESHLYAFFNDCYHIANTNFSPLFFENLDFKLFGTTNCKEIWTRLNIISGFLGLNLNTESSVQIKIAGNIIKIIADNSLNKYSFNKCFIFDSVNVSVENAVQKVRKKLYRVIDDFEIKNLGKSVTNIPSFPCASEVVNRVYFYTSDRIDGAKYITDCVVESFLTSEQLYDFDYSDTAIKFAVQRRLLDDGYRGRPIGYLKSGKPKHYKPELTHHMRQSRPLDRNMYSDSKNVKFLDLSAKEILNEAAAER